MIVPMASIQEDFDHIARLAATDAEQPGTYDAFLLEQIPPSCQSVLEVGCGTGTLSRALAARGCRVVGMDLSPEMIRLARARTSSTLDVSYRCEDFLSLSADEPTYDCVLSVATLHHLPLDVAVGRMAGLVRPGGVLVVHDVRSNPGAQGLAVSALAMLSRAGSRVRRGQSRPRAEVRAAWREHGRGERYATMPEVKAWSRRLLPGARTFWHLQWRYTVVWQRLSQPTL